MKILNQKFIITVLILSLFGLKAQAEEMATLFGGSGADKKYGAYGAFEIKYSQLDGEFGGLFLGGRGGVIINNVFTFGGAGYGLVPTKKINCPIIGHENEKNSFWTGGYGGLFFEYINSSNSLVHFTANTLLGAGGVTYTSHDYDKKDKNDRNRHPSSFVIVIEPGIGVELNVSETFRINLGVCYRYSPNFELIYQDKNIVPNTAFNGLSVNLAFKFGDFVGYTHKERLEKIKETFDF
jgi:hypothetical protein